MAGAKFGYDYSRIGVIITIQSLSNQIVSEILFTWPSDFRRGDQSRSTLNHHGKIWPLFLGCSGNKARGHCL